MAGPSFVVATALPLWLRCRLEIDVAAADHVVELLPAQVDVHVVGAVRVHLERELGVDLAAAVRPDLEQGELLEADERQVAGAAALREHGPAELLLARRGNGDGERY